MPNCFTIVDGVMTEMPSDFSKICLMNFMTLQLNKLQTKKNQHHLVDGILTAVIIQNLLIKIISEIIIRINYQLLSNAQIAEKNKNWASRNWASRNAPNHTAAKRRETRKNTTSLIAHSPPKSATNQPKNTAFRVRRSDTFGTPNEQEKSWSGEGIWRLKWRRDYMWTAIGQG